MSTYNVVLTVPRLETQRLILREITPADAEAIFHIFADDEVTRYYDLDTFTDIDQAHRLVARMADRFRSGQAMRWGIVMRAARWSSVPAATTA